MLSRISRLKIRSVTAKKSLRCFSTEATSTVNRDFVYFDNLEVKDGVAIVRFNGPNKMNTISAGMQQESGM